MHSRAGSERTLSVPTPLQVQELSLQGLYHACSGITRLTNLVMLDLQDLQQLEPQGNGEPARWAAPGQLRPGHALRTRHALRAAGSLGAASSHRGCPALLSNVDEQAHGLRRTAWQQAMHAAIPGQRQWAA